MEAEKESAIQGFPAKLLDPEIQEISREYSMLDTLQGTNISQPGEKENHLRKCLGRESVSSREGITNNGSGNRVFFLAGHCPKMKRHKSLRPESDFSGQKK